MISSVEAVGVMVNDMFPKKLSKGNSIDVKIELKFNSDLKLDTLYNSVKLYKNLNNSLISEENEFKKGDYEEVEVSISYYERTLKIVPKTYLDKDSCYTVFIKSEVIKDINDKIMPLPYISHFYTENETILTPPIIIEPIDGDIIKKLESIKISSEFFSKYLIEISTNNKFSTLVYKKEKIANGNKFDNMILNLDDATLEDNNYYIRVCELDHSLYSEPIQFQIDSKLNEELKVSDEDFIFNDNLSSNATDTFGNDFEMISCFPKQGALDVSLKINHVYAIIEGVVSLENIKEFKLVNSPFTDEDEELDTVFENIINIEYDEEANISKIYYKFCNEDVSRNYGEVETLLPNQLYEVLLNINNTIIEWEFVSKITPKYCTIVQVRNDAGEFIKNIDDKIILTKIHEYSLEALETYKDQIENDKPSRALKRWVKTKVLIDLCNAEYLTIASSLGNKSKSVGDISISESGKLPYLSEILKKFKSDLEDLEEELNDDSKFSSGVRSGNNSYPLNDRVGF